MVTKQCLKCETKKPLAKFHKDHSKKDGLNPRCKKCESRRNQEHYGQNRDKLIRQKRGYYGTIGGHLRRVFSHMNQRCNNPAIHNYLRYGGRGIQNKFKSFDKFISYVVGVLKIDPRGLQIDRIDNDGHYEKGNIRFVTAKENSNNRRIKWLIQK